MRSNGRCACARLPSLNFFQVDENRSHPVGLLEVLIKGDLEEQIGFNEIRPRAESLIMDAGWVSH
ncbi:MAG: hypothetical protein C4293_13745 [Nitrospiraceae bacterium]